MGKLFITFKENAGAVATAFIALILVVYYLVIVIPEHRTDADKYNLGSLQEFNKQLNGTFQDYINAIDNKKLKATLANYADSLQKKNDLLNEKNDSSLVNIIEDYKADKDSITANWEKAVVINAIKLERINDAGTELELYSNIFFKIDSNAMYKRKRPFINNNLYTNELKTSYKKTISKRELKERLKGAVPFPCWAICRKVQETENQKTRKYRELVNNCIESQEIDSVGNSLAKLGVVSFPFSDKRFYKQSSIITDTEFEVLLIGAVDSEKFESKAKSVHVSSVVNCILLVLLLFLSVPLIKPLISSPKEKLTQADLINTTVSIGIFIIVLVSFSLSNYLSFNQREITDTSLYRLHKTIDRAFNTELDFYRNQMDSIPELEGPHTTIISQKRKSKTALNSPYRLQNYFVMNANGDLVKDVYENNNHSFRKNFKERDYFKALVNNEGGSSVYSAVFSKNNNRFVGIYAVRVNDGGIKGFAYMPVFYKATNKLVDLDYGYLICNKSGQVLIHSDSSKSLNENIYTNNHFPKALLKLFHGYMDTSFTIDYQGKDHRFYAKRLLYNGKNSSDVPIFLLTFKKLDFESDLKLYTLVNGFIISLAYTLGIIFLAVVYSVFFYFGHMSMLSRYHIYWLFPDNSRKEEFKWIRTINLALVAAFLFLFIIGIKDLLYLSIITGVNFVFYNFVLLSQRIFIIKTRSEKRDRLLVLLAITILSNLITAYLLYYNGEPAFGLSITLFSHFCYLNYLKKQEKLNFETVELPKEDKQKKNDFTGFLSSVIAYHYFIVPVIIVFLLYSHEVETLVQYNTSVKKQSVLRDSLGPNKYRNSNDDVFFNKVTFIKPPSDALLKTASFDYLTSKANNTGFKTVVKGTNNHWKLLALVLNLLVILFTIIALTKFYTGRFFFFDLSEAYRIGYFKLKNKFENLKIILPPFNDTDLENVERYEHFGEEKSLKQLSNSKIQELPKEIVSAEAKLELILTDNLARYSEAYKKTWDELSDLEKFVMHDFAIDHFVNYKSKSILVQLMHKGLIIADPLTGRLRVMNYGFKNFVIRHAQTDAEFVKQEHDEQSKGTFSKWKLPILIIAVTILLLVMYLYKQSFDQILIVAGSALSAFGLIIKFLDSYKK